METAYNRALILAIPLVREFARGKGISADDEHVLVGLICEAMATFEKQALERVSEGLAALAQWKDH